MEAQRYTVTTCSYIGRKNYEIREKSRKLIIRKNLRIRIFRVFFAIFANYTQVGHKLRFFR